MLPSELARFRIYGDTIYPSFAGEKDLELVKEMIPFYRVGITYGEVEENVKLLERMYGKTTQGAKLVRGLHRVISRYIILSGESPVDPKRIREELFAGGPALTLEERERRLREVSERLGVDAERFMFGDMDESKVISKVEIPSPEDIVKEYNLSLLQTILFRSYRVTLSTEGNWKDLLRTVKRLGLMYTAYPNPVRIEVMGPYTLLKPSEKYGRNLAILVPYVIGSGRWSIEAEIILGKRKRRVYQMKVENHQWIGGRMEQGKLFDSSVEEDFYWNFRGTVRDWKLEREPGPLVVNGRIFLPDFLAVKDDLKVYLEVVGFWTEDYLREKVKKLQGTRNLLIPIVSEELGSGKIGDLPVVTFKRKIDPAKVYRALREIEQSLPTRRVEYELDGSDVVSLKELATKYGVSEGLLRKNLREFPGYVLLKNYYVSQKLMEQLSKEDFSGRKLQELVKERGEFITEVLERLGYKIKWVNIAEAVITK
ncbi:DUF790 family protein [Metallosphaera javensis (ex Sakai et al. 2022)]|uniref:DUF790 family protein n=1 Tax=Metallosphaera javensis (ex Sakai et al. 2022) TaxID=2775498 RepID=UPI00258DC945|nr:MAG: hypothetical protein MjAS7_1341 [Metallosphaera javensis (ex Sakai et al. 2022)]